MINNINNPENTEIKNESMEREEALNDDKEGLENAPKEIIKGLEDIIKEIESEETDKDSKEKKINDFVKNNLNTILGSSRVDYPEGFTTDFLNIFSSSKLTYKENFLKTLANQQSIDSGGEKIHEYSYTSIDEFLENTKGFKESLFDNRKSELEAKKDKLIDKSNLGSLLKTYYSKDYDVALLEEIKNKVNIDDKMQKSIRKDIDEMESTSTTSRNNMKSFYEGDFSYFGKLSNIPGPIEKEFNLSEISVKKEKLIVGGDDIIKDIFNNKLGLEKGNYKLEDLKTKFKDHVNNLSGEDTKSLYKKMKTNEAGFVGDVEDIIGIEGKEGSEVNVDLYMKENYIKILDSQEGVQYPQDFKDNFLSIFSTLSPASKDQFKRVWENQQSISAEGGELIHKSDYSSVDMFMEKDKIFRSELFKYRKSELEKKQNDLLTNSNFKDILNVYGKKENYDESIMDGMIKEINISDHNSEIRSEIKNMTGESSSKERDNMRLFYEGDFSYFGKYTPKNLEKSIQTAEIKIKSEKIISDASAIINEKVSNEPGLNDDGTISNELISKFTDNIESSDLEGVRDWYNYLVNYPERFSRDISNDLEEVFDKMSLAEKEKQVDDIIDNMTLPVGSEFSIEDFHEDLNKILDNSTEKTKDAFFSTLIESDSDTQTEILLKISNEMEKREERDQKNYKLTFSNKSSEGEILDGDRRIIGSIETRNYLNEIQLDQTTNKIQSVFTNLKENEEVQYININGSRDNYEEFISNLEENDPELYQNIEGIINFQETGESEGLSVNIEKVRIEEGKVEGDLNRLDANVIGDNSKISEILKENGFGDIIDQPNVIITGADIDGVASMNNTNYTPKLSDYEQYCNSITSNLSDEDNPIYTKNPGLALDRSLAFVKFLVDGNKTKLSSDAQIDVSYDVQGDTRSEIQSKLGEGHTENDLLEAFKERQKASISITYKKIVTENESFNIEEENMTKTNYSQFSISGKPQNTSGSSTGRVRRNVFYGSGSSGGGGSGKRKAVGCPNFGCAAYH